MQVRRNGARKTVSYVNTPSYRQCPHSRPMRRSCNGRLSLHLSVRMSVPSIDSSSVVPLVCCNQSADGRYQSIAAASARTQSGQRRVVIRGQGLFNLYDYCVVLCLSHITYACEAPPFSTRSSAIAEGPRDASCQLNFCQLSRNSAETTCRLRQVLNKSKL